MSKAFDVTLDPEENNYDMFGRPVETLGGGLWVRNEDGRLVTPTWDDTVHYDDSFGEDDVRDSLVSHDGYNPNIQVKERS